MSRNPGEEGQHWRTLEFSHFHPFPQRAPPSVLKYVFVHGMLQLVTFVLYVTAASLDVTWWREEGPVCEAVVTCRKEPHLNDQELCQSMRTDIEWLFWSYTVGIAIAVNKLLLMMGLLAVSADTMLRMLLAVPLLQTSKYNERHRRLIVCVVWAFSLFLDVGLLFSMCMRSSRE